MVRVRWWLGKVYLAKDLGSRTTLGFLQDYIIRPMEEWRRKPRFLASHFLGLSLLKCSFLVFLSLLLLFGELYVYILSSIMRL